MIDLSAALAIQGWTSESELTWLAEQASKQKTILEVGSWRGRSICAMASNTSGRCWAVDTWAGTQGEHDRFFSDQDPDWLYREFLENTRHLANVTPIRGVSWEVAETLGPILFDMIFIDGDHAYEAVKRDLIAWIPRLKRGGLLVGHDLDRGRPGVQRALNEVLPRRYRKLGIGSIWVATL